MKSTNYYNTRRAAGWGTVSLIALLLAFLLLFTACEGEKTPSEDGSSEPAETTQVPEDGTDGASDGAGTSEEPSGTTESPESSGGSEYSSETSGDDPSEITDPADTTASGEVTTGGSDPGTNPGTTVGKTDYTIKVIDANGDPIKLVIIRIFKDGEQVKMLSTPAGGSVTASLETGEYTFTLEKKGGTYLYDQTRCVLTERSPTITISFIETLGDAAPGEIIYARPGAESDHREYFAAYVGEGTTAVSLAAGGMTYFIFTPERSGVFRFSAESDVAVDIGYYGGTFNVQLNKAVDVTDGYFDINVRAGSIGSAGSTAQFVIGLRTLSGDAAAARLKIVRTGDAKLDSADVPWGAVQASQKYLTKYQGKTTGTLKDVDITDPNTKIVYNEQDGYYHLGTESGPVVMFRIDSASPYLASLTDICDTSALGCYYYDENGDFLKKEHYNDMIASYKLVATSAGVVPLNDELIAMIKAVGTHMGWWNESHPQYRFGTDAAGNPINEVTEIAWLFNCCYYEN